jgi:glycerol-3-phosphate O-acyltransferase
MHTLSKTDLIHTLDDYLTLFKALPFSDTASVPDVSAAKMVDQTLALKRLQVTQDEYGELISPQPDKAVVLTYYRNNIMHQFALPSLILALVFAQKGCEKKYIKKTCATIYPLLQRELFIYFKPAQLEELIDNYIDQFKIQGILVQAGKILKAPAAEDKAFTSAWLLSRVLQETFQRYAVVLHQLRQNEATSRSDLERGSRKIAERLSKLFGVSSPEFSDKNVFATLVYGLRENGLLTSNDSGAMELNAESEALSELVNLLVYPEIVQHLQNLD